MYGRKIRFSALSVAPIALLVACGGGGGGGEIGSNASQSGLTSQIANVPVAGQFLADCLNGTAVINDFVAQSPLSGATGSLPSAQDVLASGDPNAIPVIGGLVPSSEVPTDLVPISADDALAMIPSGDLPVDLTVVGNAPVTCSDVALPESELPDPTSVLGLVPVFNEAGDPVSLVLATVGDVQSGSVPSPSDIALPSGTDTLPDPLGSTISSLLSLLDL